MECQITFSLVLESLVGGNIGDDWKYSVQAEVFNPGPTGAGTITVPEHRLRPGTSQPPPGVGQIVIPAGSCGTRPQVKLTLNTTEVDVFFDDKSGPRVIFVNPECPGPDGSPFTIEPEVSVLVLERPRFPGSGSVTFTVKIRLVAACV